MPTITIAFRGLLVFNEHQVNGKASMEIGILNEPSHHTPRIMTFRNGVREETVDLHGLMNDPPVLWQLVVDNPVTDRITLRQPNSDLINRMNETTPPDDFRWILNLENGDFPYVNIDQNYVIERRDLKHVVQITSGEFYTRLKSQLLTRSENGGAAVDFGALAGVVGLDIRVNGSTGARLIGPDPSDPIFTFSSDPNVMYEFANSPADTVATSEDHFDHYYKIFRNQPGQKFRFQKKTAAIVPNPPGPNPALCGEIFLGAFSGSLAP
jgi:hypothetical protein